MDLKVILQILRRWYWLVILGALVALLSGYIILRVFTPWPRYEATATFVIDEFGLNAETAAAVRETYVELARRRPVTERAVENLNLQISADELTELIQAGVVGQTRLMEITVLHGNNLMAATIANEVVNQLGELSLNGDKYAVQLVAPAESPARPQLGGIVALIVSGLTGAIVAGGLVILGDYLHDRLHTAQDVEERLGVPVLATVNLAGRHSSSGRFPWPRRNGAHNRENGSAPAAEPPKGSATVEKYQWLCFGIDHAAGGAPQKLLVAAPRGLEEQLSLVTGMATTWAENNRKVVLVNASSATPVISAWYGYPDNSRPQVIDKLQPVEEPPIGYVQPGEELSQASEIVPAEDDVESGEVAGEEMVAETHVLQPARKLALDELDLPGRVHNVLLDNQIETVGDVIETMDMGEEVFLNFKGFGEKALETVREQLAALEATGRLEPEVDVVDEPSRRVPEMVVVEEAEEAIAAEENGAGLNKEVQALTTIAKEIPLPAVTSQDVVLDQLAQDADRVVVNGPPIMNSPQAVSMASYVDAVLLVLIAGQTGTREGREAIRLLRMAGGKVLGATLLNM